jgi:hypothetical protein
MKKMTILGLALAILSPILLKAVDKKFEVYNKSLKSLWYRLTSKDNQGNEVKSNIFRSWPTDAQKRDLDTNYETSLELWKMDPKEKESAPGVLPKADWIYKFPGGGKTIYVTWDNTEILRPETGPLLGKLGKTQSGLSLANNIKKEEITQFLKS